MAEANFIKFEILSVCNGGGYKYCRTNPPHPKRNTKGLYPLHRVLAENKLGRALEDGEQVHHKDGDKTNDAATNLEVLTVTEHARHHARNVESVKCECPQCGKTFTIQAHSYRLRLKRSKSGTLYCSRRCGTITQHRSSQLEGQRSAVQIHFPQRTN